MSFASRISSLRGSIAKLGSSTSSVNPHKAIAELMEKNKEFVVSDPAAAAKLHKQLFFTYLNRYDSKRCYHLEGMLLQA